MKLGKYYDELSTTYLNLSSILGIKNAKATLFIPLLHLSYLSILIAIKFCMHTTLEEIKGYLLHSEKTSYLQTKSRATANWTYSKKAVVVYIQLET